MGNFNDSSNSESQILKYKRDKELDFLCDVNKPLVIIVNICVNWYEFQSNVAYFVLYYGNYIFWTH